MLISLLPRWKGSLMKVPTGLLFFPITPFDSEGELNLDAMRRHLEDGLGSNPGGIFVACGAGEFYALSLEEHRQITELAVEVVGGRVPLYASAGGQIATAKLMAQSAQDSGVDGLLLFPPYLVSSTPEGLLRYYREIHDSSDLALIVYNRPGSILTPELACQLADLKNLVGIKDGMGEFKQLSKIMLQVEAFLVESQNPKKIQFMNGTPTAELSALEFKRLGITTYSSAVYTFVPEIALAFYDALISDKISLVERLLEDFYRPLARLRDEIEGGAISIVKAGTRIMGLHSGEVRAPLMDLSPDQTIKLNEVIKKGLQTVNTNK
jgi:5-dehydro-4-deoxyglucarate dehydratase